MIKSERTARGPEELERAWRPAIRQVADYNILPFGNAEI